VFVRAQLCVFSCENVNGLVGVLTCRGLGFRVGLCLGQPNHQASESGMHSEDQAADQPGLAFFGVT
jgi:hypothetical protein